MSLSVLGGDEVTTSARVQCSTERLVKYRSGQPVPAGHSEIVDVAK